jgi:hypothetical protein
VEQVYRQTRARYGDAGGEMLPVKLLEDLTGTLLRLPAETRLPAESPLPDAPGALGPSVPTDEAQVLAAAPLAAA